MPAAAYPHPIWSTSTRYPTMKSSKHFCQGQQQPLQPPFVLTETSFYLSSIDTPFDMATGNENDEQLALQQMWDEDFQQFILNSELPMTQQPPAGVTPMVPNPPGAPVFSDGRMAVSIYPPLPYRNYPQMTDNVLPSNEFPPQPADSSMQAVPAYGTNLGYQSDGTLPYSYPAELLGSPPMETGFPFGYGTSANSPMTTEVKAETPSTGSMLGEETSYFTHHPSHAWDSIPSHQSTPRLTPHTPGPERSSKPKSQRTSPFEGASQAAKPRHNKRAAACWRCRKYRKPCDDEAICTSCQVGNFRVWPPAIDCRRDNLEAFALAIIPPSTEDLLRTLPSDLAPVPSWRQSVLSKSLAREDLFADPASEKWSALAIKVHATGLYGMEIVDLLNITHNYQLRQKTKNPVIESASTLLSSSSDIYNIFVISADNQVLPPPRANISATIHEIRSSMARSLSLFLGLCVSSKRSDWFPSVLSFAISVAGLAMFMDAAVAMPAAARTELWEDVTQFCIGLRAQLYPTALDLLRIRANNDKQMAPLELTCWNWVPEKSASSEMGAPGSGAVKSEPGLEAETDRGSASQPETATPDPAQVPRMIRNPEGMRLVGNDEAAFDGFGELQRWVQANENVLKQGKILFSNDPFTSPTVATVCTLAPIFGIR